MAGFDPQDIRSEMAASMGDKSPDTTPTVEIGVAGMEIVVVPEQPTPLEIIAPGETGNEIDVENPPDFEALNKVFPPAPMPRRSKRQAGFDPDFVPVKKSRTTTPSNLLDPDFSSGDDSADDDFELVARPKPTVAAKETGSTSRAHKKSPVTVPQNVAEKEPSAESEEDEQSLAEFLAQLKDEKAAKKTIPDEDEPDPEMMKEFEQNQPGAATDSSSSSVSDFESEEQDDGESEDIAAADVGAAEDVADTEDNTDSIDYDLSKSFSPQFYSESALELWPLFISRELIEEKNIDVDAYGRYNLIAFLKKRKLLSTVTTVMPYCRRAVLEFYCNLLRSVADEDSAKYGRVYVRDRIYNFSPSVINAFYHTPDVEEGEEIPDIHAVISVLTGGMTTVFPDHPKKMSAAKLTSFYSVLHKTSIWNWTPSTNSSTVTRTQALVLFAIGTGRAFNFGKLIFQNTLQYAEGDFKKTKLPYPSLIYAILESQGFIANIDEDLCPVGDSLKISPAYLKGTRKFDLPWVDLSVATDVGHTAETTSDSMPDLTNLPPAPPAGYVTFAISYIRDQITYGRQQMAFARQQIDNAQKTIDHYENQVADYELLLAASLHSGQKGGVDADTDAAGPSGVNKANDVDIDSVDEDVANEADVAL
ncbi:uncharacterized protein [Primulina eburnea]|uniref:uncharacterized protein n=1 Tax=Primulina eburnea TaxID=1245227 RepID=UPI003C6C101C